MFHVPFVGLPSLGTVALCPIGRNGVVVDLDWKVPKRQGTDDGG